jgi:alpha-N-arabinofuranosidase
VVRLETRIRGACHVVGATPVPDGVVDLCIEAFPSHYVFSVGQGEPSHRLGSLPSGPLSSESAGGFTGAVIGLYVTGQGALADFREWHYRAS